MVLYVVRAGVREDWKSEATKYALGGLGAFGGFGITEFTGEFIVKASGISEVWQKVLVKALTRIGFSLLFAGLSWITGGVLAWIFFAMALGSVAGIYLDIVEAVHAGGVKGLAELAALKVLGAEESTSEITEEFEIPEFKVITGEEKKEETGTTAETASAETIPAEIPVEVEVSEGGEKATASLYG